MEDKIFDIVTDLIREDISKDEAIDKLLALYSVVGRSEQLCDLDGKTVLVKFKVTKHIPKLVIEEIK